MINDVKKIFIDSKKWNDKFNFKFTYFINLKEKKTI